MNGRPRPVFLFLLFVLMVIWRLRLPLILRCWAHPAHATKQVISKPRSVRQNMYGAIFVCPQDAHARILQSFEKFSVGCP